MLTRFWWGPWALAAVVSAAACSDDSFEASVSQQLAVPVIGDRAAVRDSIALEAPRPLCNTSGATTVGAFDFVREGREGYHVVDRAATTETPVAFLRIPGTTDLSGVGGALVTSSYGDLLRLRVDFAAGKVDVVSSLSNALAPANGFPVQSEELLIGFEVMAVPIRQESDGTVLAAWRCPTCYEPIDSDVANGRPGIITIVTSDQFAGVALRDFDAYVADGVRLMAYESREETFVKTAERSYPDPISDVRAVPGGLTAQIGQSKVLIDGEQLRPSRLPVETSFCDLIAAGADLVAVARNTNAVCGSKLSASVLLFEASALGTTLKPIGRIPAVDVTAVAVHGDFVYVALVRAVQVYARVTTQVGTYDPKLVQSITFDGHLRQLSVLNADKDQPALVVDRTDGISRFDIASDGSLTAKRVFARAGECQ